MTWLKAIPGALRLVPSWVWILLAAAVAWGFAAAWHGGKVKATFDAGYQRALGDVKAAQDRARASAIEHKHTIETADAVSAEKARSDYAKDTGDLGAGYDELRRHPAPRVQPVGRSQGSMPGVAGDPGGAPAAAEGADAGLSARPLGSELAIVNWPELLEHGQSCDVDGARMKRLQDLVREIYANRGQPIGGEPLPVAPSTPTGGEPLAVAPSTPTGGDNGK